ncbi:hypothetical protein [Chamaesiphon sp. VAR_48_metabat_403]|uniref:hypothetical protein n=1 Tax=Chamaesiphon sp. VAR_48_metabat_403 TaxID=2964700 RepID=UPI00286DA79F|nr:hypothetical protein [Chamaesiphon sp. VAR_48_metabat_403]
MSDALERIKNRQRPEVPKRDPGITPTVPTFVESSISSIPDIEKAKYPDIQISTLSDEKSPSQSVDASMSINPDNPDIEASSYSDIQISTLPDGTSPTLEVKQTTLRLEKAVSDKLQALCHQEQICREVLIEAMFSEMLDEPEMRERIIALAQKRQRKRTAMANHKRAVSMMQRVLS